MEVRPGIMNHPQLMQVPAQQMLAVPRLGGSAQALALCSSGPLPAMGACKRKVRRAWCEDVSFWHGGVCAPEDAETKLRRQQLQNKAAQQRYR